MKVYFVSSKLLIALLSYGFGGTLLMFAFYFMQQPGNFGSFSDFASFAGWISFLSFVGFVLLGSGTSLLIERARAPHNSRA